MHDGRSTEYFRLIIQLENANRIAWLAAKIITRLTACTALIRYDDRKKEEAENLSRFFGETGHVPNAVAGWINLIGMCPCLKMSLFKNI